MIVYQKARIFDPESPKSGFSVQFNPNTLEYSAGIDWRTETNVWDPKKRGNLQAEEHQSSPLNRPQGARLSVRLFFHSYINELTYSDVRPAINRIRAFLPVTTGGRDTNTNLKSSKPQISFAWGTMTHTGTLESFQVTYQMFAFDGTPVQAEVAITIRGEDPDVSAALNNQMLSAEVDTDFLQQDDALYLSSLSWLFQ